MSAISQFFPSGGGGGGNETPTGVKIPQDGVPVQILGVSGAGGGGGCNGGEGGAGAVFHATNYFVQPACTVPITIGAGGPCTGCPNGQGTQGGTTSFNYDLKPLSVIGGGGGRLGVPCSSSCGGGCPGGNGGGGALFSPSCAGYLSPGGDGLYFRSINCIYCSAMVRQPGGCVATFNITNNMICRAQFEEFPWGIKAGFPGRDANKCGKPVGVCICVSGCGGYSGGNSYLMYNFCCNSLNCPGCSPCFYIECVAVSAECYTTSITGELTNINGSGSFGVPGGCGTGNAGGMVVQWATGFGGAPPTGFPGATDISPQTPGYYTYCFTSSGSITLP